ncbi:MAG: thiamine-phosphate kinase [Janthinobacterium lividum]
MARKQANANGERKHPAGTGELALIERIRRRAEAGPKSRELRLGIGDDCAILRPRPGEETVVTTDFSLEGRHFRRDWHAPEAIGHRALARGLSDLAAMGARPVAAFLSLALPKSATEPAWVDGLLDGLLGLAGEASVPLAGGDTSEAPGEQVLIDIVLLGAVPSGKALRRNSARPGDRIFVTGSLGGAAMELQTLAAMHDKPTRKSKRRETVVSPRPAILGKISQQAQEQGAHPHLFPAPRLAAGEALRRRGLATAAIDLSDGLSTDLRHLCEASGVAAVIQSAKLPLHPLLDGFAPEKSLSLALNGGEDYELLFTVAADARVPRKLGGVPLTEIGMMERPHAAQPLVTLMDADGARSELVPGGWEHLR